MLPYSFNVMKEARKCSLFGPTLVASLVQCIQSVFKGINVLKN